MWQQVLVEPFRGGDYYAPNHSRMLVYTLGGTARLPEPQSYTPRALLPPPATATAAEVLRGEQLYAVIVRPATVTAARLAVRIFRT